MATRLGGGRFALEASRATGVGGSWKQAGRQQTLGSPLQQLVLQLGRIAVVQRFFDVVQRGVVLVHMHQRCRTVGVRHGQFRLAFTFRRIVSRREAKKYTHKKINCYVVSLFVLDYSAGGNLSNHRILFTDVVLRL